MRGPWLLSACALALPITTGARAQPGPRIQPSRDVAVTYQVSGEAAKEVPGGLNGPVRLSWDAAGQRLRAEADGRNQVALINLRTHTGEAIDTGLRVVLPLPIRAQDLQPLTLEGTRLVPRGKDVVAGLRCTEYAVEGGRAPGTVCLTPDGVALKGSGEIKGKPGSFTALSVSYGALPGSSFEVPPGYMSLSGGGKGGIPGLGDLRSLGTSLGLGRSR